MESDISTLYRNNVIEKKNHETIILFGINGVGKTSLLLQLTKNRFEKKYITTIGVNFYMKEYKNIRLSIWDTCGDEMEMQILPSHLYKQSSCFIIVLSYNSIESLNTCNNFIDYINHNIQKIKTKKKKTFIALINKSDCKDKNFSLDNAIKILREYDPNILVAEISAKNCENVLEFFLKVSDLLNEHKHKFSFDEQLIKNRGNTIFYSSNFKINDIDNRSKKNKKCC